MPRMILATAAAAAALMLALPAAAQGTPTPRFDFAAADTNSDGFLTQEEWSAYLASEPRQAARRDAFIHRMMSHDMDGDGLLSPAEIDAAMTARMETREGRGMGHQGHRSGGGRSEQRMGRMFERMNTDNDGRLSPAELEAAQARFAERGERGDHRHGRGFWSRGDNR